MKQALADRIDDHMGFRRKRGEELSGQFVVRLEPVLHRAVATAAKRAGFSLSKWVAYARERAAT